MTLCLGDWSRNLVRRGDRILESRDLKSLEGWSRNLLRRGDGGGGGRIEFGIGQLSLAWTIQLTWSTQLTWTTQLTRSTQLT